MSAEDELDKLTQEQAAFDAGAAEREQQRAAEAAERARQQEHVEQVSAFQPHIPAVKMALRESHIARIKEADKQLKEAGLENIREEMRESETLAAAAERVQADLPGLRKVLGESEALTVQVRKLAEGREVSPAIEQKLQELEAQQAEVIDKISDSVQKGRALEVTDEIEQLAIGVALIESDPEVWKLIKKEAGEEQKQKIGQEEEAARIESEKVQVLEREQLFKQELIEKLSNQAARIPTFTGTEKDSRRKEFTEPLISEFLNDALEQAGVDKIEPTVANSNRRRDLVRTVAGQIEFGLNVRWSGQDHPVGFGSDTMQARRLYGEKDPNLLGRKLGNMLGTQMHEAGSPDVLGRVIGADVGDRVRLARQWHRSIPFMVGFARGTNEVRSATRAEEQPYRLIDAHSSLGGFGVLARDVKLGRMISQDDEARAAYERGTAKSAEIYERAHTAVA